MSPVVRRAVPVVPMPPCPDRLELSVPPAPASAWLARAALGAVLVGLGLAAQASPGTVGLLVSSGPMAVRPAEAAHFNRRFASVDPAILNLLQADGVSIGVVRPGQSFIQSGALQVRSHQDYQDRLPEMQQDAAAARKAAAPWVRSPKERREAILDALPAQSWVLPYQIPSLAGQLRDHDGLHQLVKLQSMPKGTRLMAELVGARTPEQIKEFEGLMEAINGPRLEEARQASLATATPAQRQQWSQNPGLIPLDLRAFDILAPDLAYVADGAGGTVRVTVQDASVVSAWSDAQGKTRTGSLIHGQFFPPTRRILIQSSKVAPQKDAAHAHTPVHELGHAIEDSVQRHDPRFYNQWSHRIYNAFAKGSSVSDYASTNLAEYVAEGVGHYYEDPQLLRQKDPALFQLTQELLQRAAQIGRADHAKLKTPTPSSTQSPTSRLHSHENR